ncbi:MAG: AbrB/MazE/SpoVT family DNA-binding domain-containing protein [Anaerolineae bacterium]
MPTEEHAGTVTRKGQVTIPLAIRKLLGIKPSDRVTFRIIDGRVELAPTELSLEEVYGAVQPLARPEDWEGVRRQAREERARHRARKVHQPETEAR